MNFDTIEAIQTYVHCSGFELVKDKAMIQLFLIIENLVCNILENLMFVVDVHKQPALSKKHAAAVMNLMRQKTQAGGSYTVLPSEYFGSESGRYFADVSSQETNMFQAGVTRPAIDYLSAVKGGAKKRCSVVNTDAIQLIVNSFKKSKNVEFTVGKELIDLIVASVNINIDDLLVATKAAFAQKPNKKNELTMALLNSTIKESPVRFKHLVTKAKKSATKPKN